MPQLARAIGGTDFIRKPLTKEEIIDMQMDGDCIDVYVAIELSEIIEHDFEGYLDIISEAVVGNCLLQEISTSVADATDDDCVVLHVTGYVNEEDLDEWY